MDGAPFDGGAEPTMAQSPTRVVVVSAASMMNSVSFARSAALQSDLLTKLPSLHGLHSNDEETAASARAGMCFGGRV